MNRIKENPHKQALALDQQALQAAREGMEQGAITPAYGPWREAVVQLLNQALATELVCVLRYRRHHFTAAGMDAVSIADEFLVHANQELAHADRLAERIVQLGGEPDFNPAALLPQAHADYDDSLELTAMIEANLAAERVAVEAYRQMIERVADKDPTTRRLLESILAEEEQHADELSDWLNR
ncbi:ferritin-like domain-containing protein [Balneatrix alpica]|uniref:ferroxidase n=1 Tax=Balneatrix alpica TaxID=75684 RepID=A0ABV5Z9S3_9GAMM|nr:ferritin-like domain-containing protein [Balneatrix alpica]